MIKWGILACGGIAHKFASDLNQVEGCELLAVASRSLEKAKLFAQEHIAKRSYGSYEELAKDPDVDVIYVASPHPMHKNNTLLCLYNGKHVLCEKAFAMNTEEVSEMIAAAKANDRFLMEAIWTQFFPFMAKLKGLIHSGALGEIVMIEADFGFKAPKDYEGRLYNPKLGGSALLDIGIYPLFLAHSLMGPPDEIQAQAIMGPTNTDVSTAMNLKWNNGVLASLNCTILTDTQCKAKIYGTEGSAQIDSRWHESKSMSIRNGDKIIEEFTFQDDFKGYAYEIEEVNSCLRESRRESQLLPLNFSYDLMQSLDKIRSQIGLEVHTI